MMMFFSFCHPHRSPRSVKDDAQASALFYAFDLCSRYHVRLDQTTLPVSGGYTDCLMTRSRIRLPTYMASDS